MKGLKVEHYDNVEDIIDELLSTMCGLETVYGIDNLEKNVEYVCGAVNTVKLGDEPNTLLHKHKNGWSEEVDQTETNYMHSTYYRKDKLEELIEKHLNRKFYNNDFLDLE